MDIRTESPEKKKKPSPAKKTGLDQDEFLCWFSMYFVKASLGSYSRKFYRYQHS